MTKENIIKEIMDTAIILEKSEEKVMQYIKVFLEETLPKNREYGTSDYKRLKESTDKMFFEMLEQEEKHRENIKEIFENY